MSRAPHSEVEVTLDMAREMGLQEDEFGKLCEILGRDPSYTELGIASALWSEHCSYKSSKIHLRKFPSEGPSVMGAPPFIGTRSMPHIGHVPSPSRTI